ncbi:MAG TPA: hypothetical protein VHV31_12435, partial [Nitrolancea sp.]|nr:hypothetical protein [Nitrolancea sp.]
PDKTSDSARNRLVPGAVVSKVNLKGLGRIVAVIRFFGGERLDRFQLHHDIRAVIRSDTVEALETAPQTPVNDHFLSGRTHEKSDRFH